MASASTQLAFGSGTAVKVAVVSPYSLDEPGGVQDQVIEIDRRLRRLGVESWVVGPGTTGPPGARLLGRALQIPANGSRAPVGLNPNLLRTVVQAVDGADVVHLHEPLIPLVGWTLLARKQTPMVATFHADPSSLIRGLYRALAPLLRPVLDRIDQITTVSEVAASAIKPLGLDYRIIPNAIDLEGYGDRAAKINRRVAFIGRDEARKGLDTLLAAWPLIRAVAPDAELDVVGTSRDTVIDGVRFHGRVEAAEKRLILDAARVFVAPNLGGESFGITLLEGMAAGCAVIASDLDAFRAVGGEAARYFPKGNAEELARQVIEVLGEEEVLERLAAASVERSQLFEWATVLPAYIEMYESALSHG